MGPVTLLFLWGGGCSGVISDIFHRKLIFCVGRFADIPRAHHFCTFDRIFIVIWKRVKLVTRRHLIICLKKNDGSWWILAKNRPQSVLGHYFWMELDEVRRWTSSSTHTHTHQFLVSMLIEDFKLQLNRLNSIVLHPAPPKKKNEHSLNLQIDGLL